MELAFYEGKGMQNWSDPVGTVKGIDGDIRRTRRGLALIQPLPRKNRGQDELICCVKLRQDHRHWCS